MFYFASADVSWNSKKITNSCIIKHGGRIQRCNNCCM
jgi:hypothetical protein